MTTGEKLFIEGKIDEAYDVLMEEAAKGNGRAMYLLGEYAKHPWLTPVDWELAKTYADAGAKAGDVLADFNRAYAMPYGSEAQKAHLAALLPKVQALAEAGDALAMYEMADVCAQGICCERSVRGRWVWNEKCAAKGLWIARARMGSLYLWADGEMADFQDVEKGVALLLRMIREQRKSSGEAAQLLADHYLFTGDLKKSYAYSELAVKWGHPLGYFFLGRHYMIGEAVPQDFPKAIELLKKTYDSHGEMASDAALYIGNAYTFSFDTANAFSWYKKAADMGNDRGWLELGVCYQEGLGVVVDEEKALALYRKAYESHSSSWCDAAFHMARLLEGKDNEKALGLALEAAKAGHWEAMIFLIHLYTEVEVDYSESLRWAKAAYDRTDDANSYKGELANHIAACYNRLEDFENCLLWAKKAADLGMVSAMYEYAHMLYEKDATPAELKEARSWFLKYIENISQEPACEDRDAALGDAANLAGMCCTRLAELEEAIPLFEKAAHYKDPFGMMNLGGLYLGMADEDKEKLPKALDYFMMAENYGKDIFDDQAKGISASQISICYRKMEDEKNCFYWANKSASYRCEVGMIDLGMLYAKGIGTLKDMDKAIQWLAAAYELQGIQAGETANYLGLLYEELKDFKTASAWFRKSADLGTEWAMYNLATHYEAGDLSDDGRPDYEHALLWYEKAIACGGEAKSDAEEGASRCKAAAEGNQKEEIEFATTNLKDLYMPWHATMKWGGKGD